MVFPWWRLWYPVVEGMVSYGIPMVEFMVSSGSGYGILWYSHGGGYGICGRGYGILWYSYDGGYGVLRCFGTITIRIIRYHKNLMVPVVIFMVTHGNFFFMVNLWWPCMVLSMVPYGTL